MISLEKILEENRRELLDLSTRNRLLSMPVETKSARVVHISDERSDEIFRLLVNEKKTLSFVPGRQSSTDDSEDEADIFAPDDESDEPAARHRDSRLQTSLTPEGLQRRLLSLYRDARTIEEEQGVNILYLALGRLEWFEAEKADTPRYAPLILVPVQLQRSSARDRFSLRWREEEAQENLSLAAKLQDEFGVTLPLFPTEDDLVPSRYVAMVKKAIASQPRWEVQGDAIQLGFFSFAKFLMYRDLDAKNWPNPENLLENPTLSGLLRDGFPLADSPFPDDPQIDELIPAERLDHVIDADSSQTLAIEMVRQGRSVVIQGPPGTGKSQSITNLIATAVLDGKKVLFVAEKLAALEVVKRRLDAIGLGALCLELHSQKSNKRSVLEEIRKTWMLGRPRGQELESLVNRLEETRQRLNQHAAMLHTRLEPSGETPFRIMGALAKLDERGKEQGEFHLPEAASWDKESVRERRALLSEMAQRIAQMGLPCEHPWRGAERETILNIDLPSVGTTIDNLASALFPLREAARQLADNLQQPEPPDFLQIELLRRMAAHIAEAPPLDREALCNSVWNAGLDELRELVAHGTAFIELRARLSEKATDAVFETDLTDSQRAIITHGESLFRFLNGEYRHAMATLRGVLKQKPPKAYTEQIALLDEIIAGQKHLKAIRQDAEIGKQAFGSAWSAEDSNWEQLDAIVQWVQGGVQSQREAEIRRVYSTLDQTQNIAELGKKLGERMKTAWQTTTALKAEVELNLPVAFNSERLEQVPLATLEERITQWRNKLEDLTRWNTWFLRARRARQLELGPLVEALEAGHIPASSTLDVFDRAYYSQLLREAARSFPELAQFDGLIHQRLIDEFRQTDLDRIKLAKYRVLSAHFAQMPARNAGIGATGFLLDEMERKRGHSPVRKLLKNAGSVVQAIKPVFMMSPLSVAQFLEPGAVEFDLLVIDEASQVQPVDALGACVRAKQHVVVGDSKQLPPTRFFARLTSSDDESEISDDEVPTMQAKDVESILGLCLAKGLRNTMLRWHYRSRHHSLIAVSNREFYEDKLFIVPSPHLAGKELGLRFHFVKGGIYDRGSSATNRIEANAVCRAVLEHARRNPELSLGVAAFSMKQQQIILDELELLRRENTDTEEFFHAHPHEPFFVKNLENVQGDERDVIFISVGYGPDASGYIAMNFGPLSNDGGERRLNVLISRAKRRCEVFASLRAADIDLARASKPGVRAFKAFLQYAETGVLSVAENTGREEDSPFEIAVRRAVESLGYEVHPQVGVAGFFIDLAVVDPAKPGRYLMGIECDGAAYHSSRSARDRDRLRQAVLEDHGWNIHRIWSTDWFQRPSEQIRKVAAALEAAKIALAEVSATPESAPLEEMPEIQRDAESPPENAATELAIPYEEANLDVPRYLAPHELSSRQMADVLLKIVQIESPIHEDELIARVRDLWLLGRAGSRIQESVRRGIATLLNSKQCQRAEKCLFLPDIPVRVRNRENIQSTSLRKPDYLPPQEIRAAIESVLVAHHGATKDELIVAVARLFGFKATSAALRETIECQIEILEKQHRLAEQEGFLKINEDNRIKETLR